MPIEADFTFFLEQLANKLSTYSEQIKDVPNVISKLHSESNSIHYIVVELKTVLKNCLVPNKVHLKLMSEIITGVMKEDCSEDRLRKLLN